MGQRFARLVQKVRGYTGTLRQNKVLMWSAAALAALVLPLFYQCMIEFVRIRSVTSWLLYLQARVPKLVPGAVFLSLVFVFITLLTARPWVANLVTGTVLWAAGVGNYYKLAYRGDPMVPRDLVQVGEALQITGSMDLRITREILLFALAVLLATLLLLPFRLPLAGGKKRLVLRFCSAALVMVCIPAMLLGYIGNRERMLHTHGVAIQNITVADSYYSNSFVTSFLYLLATQRTTPPQGYSRAGIEAVVSEWEPLQSARDVDVVIVLLESFYDIRQVPGTRYGEALYENYEHYAGQGIAGNMYADRRGGGTSGFEFSVLTGFSLENMPIGSVPYIENVDQDFPSLAKFYAGRGYSTVALHPYYGNFYNRNITYPRLGFDTYIDRDGFDEADVVGTYIGDEALGARIIAEYEAATADGGNVFLHAVSMQSHMPYNGDVYEAGYAVEAHSGMGAEYDGALSAYATGMRDADALIGQLCSYFEDCERDVVLLFYGDHQSEIAPDGMEDLYTLTDAWHNADETGRWRMTHNTLYLMWANYQTVGAAGPNLAPAMLAATALDVYGASSPAWFGWLAAGRDACGGVVNGYLLAPDGGVSRQAGAAVQNRLETWALLQYDCIYGKRYALQAMFT